jgi:beta-lactamase regulating signal transducer with metallopeptidase domain
MNHVPNWLIENSIIVAAALPIVWLVGRCRSTRPAELHLLWLVLLVKLVTPPVAQWPLALDDVAALLQPTGSTAQTVSPEIDVQQTGVIEEELELAIEELSGLSADELTLASVVPTGTPTELGDESTSKPFPWKALLIGTWAAGTSIVVGLSLLRLLRLIRFLRGAEPAPSELQTLIARIAEQYRLQPVPAFLAKGFASPCICCLGRPVMLWPDSLCVEDDPRGSESIIAHELAHIARRDHWVARFELLALWSGWWNPLFWLVRWQLHESRELACDALSMEVAAPDRRAFAELLLEFSQVRRPALSAVSMVGAGIAARFSLRRRLRMLFDHRVSGRLSLASFALAAAFGVAVLPGFTRGQEKSDDAATLQEEVGGVIEVKVDVKDSDSAKSEDAAPVIEDISVDVESAVNLEALDPVVADVELVFDDIVDPTDLSEDAKVDKKDLIKRYRVVTGAKPRPPEESDDSDDVEGGELFKLHEGVQSIRVRLLGPNVVQIEEIGPNLNSVRVLKLHGGKPDPQPKKTRTIKMDPESKVLHFDEGGRVHKVEIDAKLAELTTEIESAKADAARAQQDVARAMVEKVKAASAQRAEMAKKMVAEKQAHAAEFQISRVRYDADRESLQEELELAELGMMEKQIELEEAAEHAKKAPDDSAAARRLKLAELGVRRAKVEAGRIQRRLGQLQEKGDTAPAK